MSDDPVSPPDRAGRTYEKTGRVSTKVTAGAEMGVTRGLNDTRLAILAIMVSIACDFAFGVEGPWWYRVLLGLAVFAGIAVGGHVVLSRERPTHVVMAFAHWVLGRKH
jgi:hypothetical protein